MSEVANVSTRILPRVRTPPVDQAGAGAAKMASNPLPRAWPTVLFLLCLASGTFCREMNLCGGGVDCPASSVEHSLDFNGDTAVLRGDQLTYLNLGGEVPPSTFGGFMDLLSLTTSPKILFSRAYLTATQECSFAPAKNLHDLDSQAVAKSPAVTQVDVAVFEPLRLVVKCRLDADITLHTKGACPLPSGPISWFGPISCLLP